MKTVQYLLIAAIISVSACNDPDGQGSSTPIDTTNIRGTAPATYGDAPNDTTYPKYEGQEDEGLRANTASSEDSAAGRHK